MFCFQSLLWKFSLKLCFRLLITPLPASAKIAASGFWQIASVKDTNNLSSAFQGRVFTRGPFSFSVILRV